MQINCYHTSVDKQFHFIEINVLNVYLVSFILRNPLNLIIFFFIPLLLMISLIYRYILRYVIHFTSYLSKSMSYITSKKKGFIL